MSRTTSLPTPTCLYWLVLASPSLLGCGEDITPGHDTRAPVSAAATEAGYSLQVAQSGQQPKVFDFSIELDEALAFEVEEHGLDIAVEIIGPSGDRLLRFDSPSGGNGLERICFAPPQAGSHRLRVSPPDTIERFSRSGSLHIRKATQEDRDCWRASQLFADAESRLELESTALLPVYREAARLFRRSRSPYREAMAHLRLAKLHFLRGELEAESAGYREAAYRFRDAGGRPYEEATALNLLADALWRQGRPDLAESILAEALTLAESSGMLRAEASIRSTAAQIQLSRGEAHLAAREIRRSLSLWQELGLADREAATLHLLGQIHVEELSQLREAVDFLEQALALWRQQGRTREEADSLILLGWAHYRAGEMNRALRTLRRALRLSEAWAYKPGAAAVLDRMGSVYRAMGRLDEAQQAFERSLHLSVASQNLRNRSQTLGNLGHTLIAGGEFEDGEARLEQSLEELRPLGDRDAMADVLIGLAEAERSAGELDAALGHYRRAMALLDSLHLSARQQGGRLAANSIWQGYYEDYVDLLVEKAEVDRPELLVEAVEVSELNRARALYEILREADLDIRSEAAPELLGREKELILALDALWDGDGKQEPDKRLRQRRALSLSLETVREEIRRSNPRFLALRRDRAPSLAEIQAFLDDRTRILSLALGDRRSFLFEIGAEQVKHYVLPPRSSLERLARATYAGLLRRRDLGARQAERMALALSRDLFNQLGPLDDVDRLVVVPDGGLAYLPFAALPRPSEPDALWIDTHEVVQLPSAAIIPNLVRRASRRRRPEKSVAVLAGPVFSPLDLRLKDRGARLPSPPQGSGGLGPIPFATVEAAAILKLFPADQRYAALGFDARLQFFHGGQLADFSILHIATHAVIDEEYPGRSYLLLSRFDRDGRRLRGELRLTELYTLHMPADLVVLSACRTALGKPTDGDGLVGLTHGFLYAGASRLLVSLWDVDDQATAELMARFHRELRESSVPPGEALRRAQLNLRRDPQYALPYYWAGFVLQGDWRPLPNKKYPRGN